MLSLRVKSVQSDPGALWEIAFVPTLFWDAEVSVSSSPSRLTQVWPPSTMSGWLSRLRSTFVVAEPAGAGSGSPDDGASDADETLRRFETVVPARYESGGPPNLPTAPTPADSPAGGAAPLATPLVSLPASERVALPLRVADSQGKVERLKTLLDEFNQVA